MAFYIEIKKNSVAIKNIIATNIFVKSELESLNSKVFSISSKPFRYFEIKIYELYHTNKILYLIMIIKIGIFIL